MVVQYLPVERTFVVAINIDLTHTADKSRSARNSTTNEIIRASTEGHNPYSFHGSAINVQHH